MDLSDRVRLRGLDWLNVLRPKHQVKNTLVLLPVVASHNLDPGSWLSALLAGVAFCFCASGVYLLNDVYDRTSDRHSPSKANRAIAAGRIGLFDAILAGVALMLFGMCVAASVSAIVAAWVGGYVVAAACYTIWIKRVVMLDVVVLASLYELRIAGGVAAIGLDHVSPWLFAVPLFAFLALAFAKRLGEIRAVKLEPDESYPGRAWKTSDGPLTIALGSAFAAASALAAFLYADSTFARAAYTNPEILWVAPPAIVYGLGRILLVANRGELGEDPVAFAITDSLSWAGVAVVGAVFWIAL